LRESDWDRFDFYARRIRQLGDDSPHSTENVLAGEEVDTDVFVALVTYRPTRDFFPNLRTLQSTPHSHEVLRYFPAFLGPKMNNVIIDCEDWTDTEGDYFPVASLHVANLLASLSQLKAKLQILHIFMETWSPELTKAFFDLVNDSHDLRILVIDEKMIPHATIDHLAHLPALEKLSDVEIAPDHLPLFSTSDGRFPKLAEWSFDAPGLSSCTALLKSMQQCQFTVLRMSCYTEVEHVSRVLELTTAITNHRSHSSLTTLDLFWNDSIRDDPLHPDGTSLSISEALHPLFFLPLEHVHISSEIVHDLDDSWIAQAALAWPLLNFLSLLNETRTTSTLPNQFRITLAGLIPLIKHCPRLHCLSMRIDAQPVSTNLMEGARNTCIRTVNFQGSLISHPRKIFRSLIQMFPNLTSVTGQMPRPSGVPVSPDESRYNRHWDEVAGLLRST
jgi:hypothetical protein